MRFIARKTSEFIDNERNSFNFQCKNPFQISHGVKNLIKEKYKKKNI